MELVLPLRCRLYTLFSVSLVDGAHSVVDTAADGTRVDGHASNLPEALVNLQWALPFVSIASLFRHALRIGVALSAEEHVRPTMEGRDRAAQVALVLDVAQAVPVAEVLVLDAELRQSAIATNEVYRLVRLHYLFCDHIQAAIGESTEKGRVASSAGVKEGLLKRGFQLLLRHPRRTATATTTLASVVVLILLLVQLFFRVPEDVFAEDAKSVELIA